MSDGVRVEKRDRGDLWLSFLLSHFQYSQFWFGMREGMLGAQCWLLQLVLAGGWAAFPQFTQTGLMTWWGGTFLNHMAPTLAPETLEGAGILPVSGAPWLSLDSWAFSPWS